MTSFIPTVPPLWQTQLAFDLIPSDTTATLSPELLISGIALPAGSLVCVSIDIGQPNPEYIIGTLTANILTFTIRNVDPLDPTVSMGAFTSTHGQGAVVKITDFATIQIMRNILNGTQALQNPLISNSPAVLPTDVPNYSQLTGAIISGGVPANVGVMGLSELSASPNVVLGNPTISITSPAVITLAGHGLHANDIVKFTTTGALPTGIVSGTSYYVISAGLTANTFEISATGGGTAINTSGSQSGTHTLTKLTPVAVETNDYRINGNSFGVSAVGTDAYAITLLNAPTAYISGIQFSFQADVSNTGAATLNVNGLGAKTIKKNVSQDLVTGDIAVGQIIQVEYDGTNFQLISILGGNIASFGGNGSDGALSVPSGTTTIDLGSAAIVTKNYTSINIAAGATLNFINPHTNGTIIQLKSQGNVTIAGTIDASGMGASGGSAGPSGNGNGGNGSNPNGKLGTENQYGGGGVNATSGIAGAVATLVPFYAYNNFIITARMTDLIPGAGGGGGGGGNDGGANSILGGTGGKGGGAIYIECAGALNFTGTINTSGLVGGAGTAFSGSLTTAYGSASGGGGGAAGMQVIIYNTLTANSGTMTASGGGGGTGGSATVGGGSSSGTGSFSGAGAGSIASIGAAGVNSNGTTGVNAPGLGSGASGGSGRNSAGVTVPGGTGGGSMGGIVIKNTMFT